MLLEIRQERVNRIVYPTPHLQEERKRTFSLKLQGREGWAPAPPAVPWRGRGSVISAVSRKAAGRFLPYSPACCQETMVATGFTQD